MEIARLQTETLIYRQKLLQIFQKVSIPGNKSTKYIF